MLPWLADLSAIAWPRLPPYDRTRRRWNRGYRSVKVAVVLNVTSGKAVSKQLEKGSRPLEKDESVQKTMADVERRISSHH